MKRTGFLSGFALIAALATAAGLIWQMCAGKSHQEPNTQLHILVDTLEELRKHGNLPGASYVPPAPEELESFGQWFGRLLMTLKVVSNGSDALGESLLDPSDDVHGFSARTLRIPRKLSNSENADGPVTASTSDSEVESEVVVVSHRDRRGAGAYLLRKGLRATTRPFPLIIEAPHTFFDVGTLPIAVTAFLRDDADALLINTAHRYTLRPPNVDTDSDSAVSRDPSPSSRAHNSSSASEPAPQAVHGPEHGVGDSELSSDLAHTSASFFHVAHNHLSDMMPSALVVQFHGFADRVAAHHQNVALILSASKTPLYCDLDEVCVALRRVVGEGGPLVYPSQIKVLGGTTNAQARHLAALNRSFLHIEMSRSLRKRLTSSLSLLEQFTDLLFDTIASTRHARPNGP